MRLIIVFLLLISCGQKKAETETISDSQRTEAIKKVLNDQQLAWNRGDIDGFMEGYWDSPNLRFMGKSGLTKGWNQTLENYKKGYPDLDAMGKLDFQIIEMEKLSEDIYLMIGKYTLERKSDKPSGYFSLIWKNISGEWLIVADHTSG